MPEPVHSVGAWYEEFEQTTDDEVGRLDEARVEGGWPARDGRLFATRSRKEIDRVDGAGPKR